MLLGKNKRFRSRMESSFLLSVQYAVFILNKRNVFWRHTSEKKQSYHLATKCIDFLGQYTFRVTSRTTLETLLHVHLENSLKKARALIG